MKLKLTALAIIACLTSCVTAPNGNKSLDPAVTAAVVALAKTPEGQAIIDAAVAKVVAKINPPAKPLIPLAP